MSVSGGPDRQALFAQVDSSPRGLGTAVARARLQRYGTNTIAFHRVSSPLRLLAAEFLQMFPLLLLAASGLAFLAHRLRPGEGYELIGAALLAVVVLNAVVSFAQNHKVEKLMVSFLDYIPRHVAVLRDGQKTMLDAGLVVPGDVLFLQEGDKVCADGVVIEGAGLALDESLLGGESEPVAKTPLGERVTPACQVASGATVLRGHARVLVTRTGLRTSLGAISELSQRVRQDPTPMQRELRVFVHRITLLAVSIGLVFFGVGFAIGNPAWTNLVFAIGIIVANVPEGLLPTVTLALTQSSLRMAKRNAVVKHILSVETLGSTTVVCTDKTGTLTRNRLHVETVCVGGDEYTQGGGPDEGTGRVPDRMSAAMTDFRDHPARAAVLEVMALCNDAIATREAGSGVHFQGDPTETALAEFVELHDGFDTLRRRFRPVSGEPFDAATRVMSSVWQGNGGNATGERVTVVKGAPEVVVALCGRVYAGGAVVPLHAPERQRVLARAESLAAQGLRVLALARNGSPATAGEDSPLSLVGLVALVDPPRPEVPAAVAACHTAGIRIVVMSGDKGATVAYIAKKLGIVHRPRIIEGEELAAMSRPELAAALRGGEVVFARVAPEQKLHIVEAFKEMGEVVAVTGDGVNDAPALKRADIGIAMGLRGTDVAKEASDIILLDDNFATIVKAIEEGRSVYDNIRKFITYVLSSNVPEIVPFIAYVLLPIPLAMTVVQILAIDLITDILPAIGLGNEPPEADTMRRPPRRSGERLVTARTFVRAYGVIGPVETGLSFAAFFAVLFGGGWRWGVELGPGALLYGQATAAFLATIVFSQIGNVLACRTTRGSAWRLLARLNPWILAGIAVEVVFIVTVVQVPVLHRFFTTEAFPPAVWGGVVLAPAVVFGVEELRKYLVRAGG
ncbi:MAG: cation-transporting P-type ATPase [Nitrospirota bacterium]|nr:cation-transporting P-type ATPase [Nitrospirota bacterium]